MNMRCFLASLTIGSVAAVFGVSALNGCDGGYIESKDRMFPPRWEAKQTNTQPSTTKSAREQP
jgi:hypothetical protein